ncbi:type II toxin-antitoxin system death-on-curing family toxin [Streptomyces lacrimifluminis]|uniref:Toxin Doc n=1 Tax=Streptomyces lacrimifluminis TaxID=1500077 RepID=A0A917NV83_9ACTN|nr:type II toxin-antitoxin system death-on-curing family toxin [Streptomyces lacrimifluminis]GGJ31501.1 toxin Doc [Streptomyces lacrimifluminis]
MTYVYLSAEDVLGIAGLAVEGRRVIVRDVGLVAAAAHRPSATPLGQEAYTDLFDKAAAFLQSLAIDRPFVDGNKRTAWTSCVVFLALNGVQLRPDIDAAERLVIAVASGSVDEVKVISEVLRDLAEPSV